MDAPAPYIEPPRIGPTITIKRPALGAPFQWLGAGWKDLTSAWPTALFYGLCFWVMAVTLAVIFQNKPEYAMSIASGCLLVGPFLAMGLYEVSRMRELGQANHFTASLMCWRNHIRSMGMLILVLMVLELLWGRASLVVFAVFFNTGMPSTTGALQAVFNPDNIEFLMAYLLVGGFFTALVFSISVVSIPFIRDKDVDAITATITSVRVVLSNPLVMFIWGICLTTLTLLALLPAGLGLILIGPLLGHASWHAYRATVQWTPQPEVNATTT
jgi:uncharacterized membrane protein